ncbi:lactonase family protein [Phycisphaera mikurensis]|uniref:6-phosphogluconolactonase n=1 Tax=Phycisphaera mikurensis (strain NBRC 102666 / KCTC 22515 / FYK2301M01) TaxID=1142394 RepID=I0II54_PHYMF|nr:lactonase family protein [Phycisphaera mikurensis]MBB6442495.1 6-phosphogluconolactonase [Phycisphaera mikurensis]BAM04942.1 hypothetical protein PSMK_27830 [Phycisphaera mikurensis NBRC 102666]
MNPAPGLLLGATLLATPAAAEPRPFFIGTDADGVYASTLDTDTGAMSPPVLAAAMEAPGFLWIHPTLPVLYAVGGGGGSRLVAFRIGGEGGLTRSASVGTGGEGACFVTVSPDGRLAAVAHYNSGSVALFPLADDGTPGEPTVARHAGRSVNEKRQTAPHAHSVRFTPDGRTLMAADLGTDKLYVYSVTGAGGLEPASPAAIDLPPGSGPRHFVFTPGGGAVLILNELAGTVSVAPVDPVTGGVTRTLPAVAADLPADAERASAEILFHPGGRHVYASNRGPGEIAWFAWNGENLERRGGVASGGDWPRNFRLTEDGRFLLVANQRSGNVASFRIDAQTGELVATGESIDVPGATCIKFRP